LTQSTIVFSQSPYAVLSTDSTISCNATSGAVIINLPSATGTGRVLRVKKTDSSANGCTLTRAGSDAIDGSTTVALTSQYASSTVEDSASATWIRTHVNQVGGDVAGASTSQQVVATHLSSALPISQGGTGTASTLTGLVRGSGSAMTAAELSGDATTSGSNAVTVSKVNGVSLAGLATGILRNTTGTGAPSIAGVADFPFTAPSIPLYKLTDKALNNQNHLTVDTDFSTPSLAIGVYLFEGQLLVDDTPSGGVAGFQFDLEAVSGAFNAAIDARIYSPSALADVAAGLLTTSGTTLMASGMLTYTTSFKGIMFVMTASVIELKWAQVIASPGTDTTVLKGSYLTYRKLP
jgi:hypothetical protein